MLRLCGFLNLAFFPILLLLSYFKKQHRGKKSASFPGWNMFLRLHIDREWS